MKNLPLLALLLFSFQIKAFELFRLEVQGNGFADETVVMFSELATDSFYIQEDSYKLFSIVAEVPGICTKNSGNYLAINQLYTLNQDKVVEVVLKIQTSGTYTIKTTDFSSMPITSQIYLEDVSTGVFQNLRQNPNYVDQFASGMIQSRFYLHFRPPLMTQVTIPSCSNNDGQLTINYNSSTTINLSIYNNVGTLISEFLNFSGVATLDSLLPGNYTFSIIFSDSSSVYSYATINSNYPIQNSLQVSSTQVIPNLQVIFVVLTSYSTTNIWDFGDGTIDTTVQTSVSHTYTQPGQYSVSVISDNTVCSDTAYTQINVLNISGIKELDYGILKRSHFMYDMSGQEVKNPETTGIYVIYSDGRFKKIYLK
jgi:hypothetical protein